MPKRLINNLLLFGPSYPPQRGGTEGVQSQATLATSGCLWEGWGGLSFLFCIYFVSMAYGKSYAQNQQKDLLLIQKSNFRDSQYNNRKIHFMHADSKNALAKYNPIRLTLGSLMFVYQKVLSPQIAASCPYEISCSNFSKASIAQFGLLKGVALTSDRLMRCNRLAAFDIPETDVNYSTGKIADPISKYRLKNE